MSKSFQKTELEDLAKKLCVTPELLFDLVANLPEHYRRFPIHSGRSRPRWIDAPSGVLKLVQRRLLDGILYGFSPHECAHGFYPERSILTNAHCHTQKKWVLSFDIRDFFPSTKKELVLHCLRGRNATGSNQLLPIIAELCCLGDCLPQGAPTSPHLANICFFECDEILSGIARKHELSYTRYADDMTFSGEIRPVDLERKIEDALALFGYVLSKQKTKVMGQSNRQKVTGLIVNEKLSLPRELRKRLRAIKHDAKKNGLDHAIARSISINSEKQFLGYLAFKEMVEKFSE